MKNEHAELEYLQLESLLKYAPGFFYWKDQNSVYQGCNDEFARLAGLESREQVKGKTDFELAWKERATLYVEVDKKVIDSGEAKLNIEDVITIANGNTIIAITNKVPLFDNQGKAIGILGITTDITHLKEIEHQLNIAKEAAEAANIAKSEFIANISHDIRTPLTGVVGLAHILENILDDPKQKNFAYKLGKSGDQLLNMFIEVIENVSAEDMNESNIQEEAFNIYHLIQGLADLEEPSIISKGLRLITYIDPHIPSVFIGDREKIQRALLNIVGNAIKFTKAGYVEIKATLLEKNENRALLKFQVIDTGEGIAPENQKKIFDRFCRLSPSHKEKFKGFGLGLNIAESYIKLLGGQIDVDSQPGVGSTFWFTLPLKIGDENTIIPAIETEDKLPSKPVNKEPWFQIIQNETTTPENASCILIIEDNKVAITVIENLVSYYKLAFRSAVDGESALELAKKKSFDLIFSDIGLPGISGVDFTRQLRIWEKEQHKSPVPIIGLTAHAVGKVLDECLQAGMNDVKSKPLSAAALQKIITQYSLSVSTELPFSEAASPAEKNTLGRDLPETEEELFSLDHFPLLDVEKAITTLGSINILKELLSMMIKEAIPTDETSIKQAHAKGDWERVENLAHKLKSGAVYCGATKMQYACQYLERYRKAGHSKLLERLYSQLLYVLDETKQVTGVWLQEQL